MENIGEIFRDAAQFIIIINNNNNNNNNSTQETLIYRNATATHLDAFIAHIDATRLGI